MQIKPHAHPREVFKTLANWEALQEYREQDMQAQCKPLPKYTPQECKPKQAGWINFFSQLRP